MIKTIVLVLKDGKGFSFRDVELISHHIHAKWRGMDTPRIICLWNRASRHYNLGKIEILPLTNDWRGTWSRMETYSPDMEKYRPFLYIDLDTAIIQSVENIFNLVQDKNMYIPLEDFWQRGELATGLVWFPAKSEKVQHVWEEWLKNMDTNSSRMDYFLRRVIEPDLFWQQLTDSIIDFKAKSKILLTEIPKKANLVCFHGKPRIQEAKNIEWVDYYINEYENYNYNPL